VVTSPRPVLEIPIRLNSMTGNDLSSGVWAEQMSALDNGVVGINIPMKPKDTSKEWGEFI